MYGITNLLPKKQNFDKILSVPDPHISAIVWRIRDKKTANPLLCYQPRYTTYPFLVHTWTQANLK